MTRSGVRSAVDVFGGTPAVIGHRGLGRGVVSGHRENTLASFAAAAELGLRWVEVDVRRTLDDVLVIAHDPVYPDGSSVSGLTAAAADRHGALRLSSLFERLPPGVGVNVDLKSPIDDSLRPPSRTAAGLLGPVVAAEATRRRVLVSSFDPAALHRVRSSAPRVSLAWLTWRQFPLETAVAGCAHMDVDVLALHVGSLARDPRARRAGAAFETALDAAVDTAAVERALSHLHDCGRQLLVWCPDVDSARLLVEAGADAVVVDSVPGALAVLSST
ncbi:glycerophosphodiester phosphodiesterase [Modestobacter sp. I12A-02662]|uniref:glycerophosphodiester phosphodiesterase n=1 Tax=Modestobacter sp. I12A-02662 TaxID=1730496 RepID=UPI0034E00D6B